MGPPTAPMPGPGGFSSRPQVRVPARGDRIGRPTLWALGTLWLIAAAVTRAGVFPEGSIGLDLGPLPGFAFASLAAATSVGVAARARHAWTGTRPASRWLIALAAFLFAAIAFSALRGGVAGPAAYAAGTAIATTMVLVTAFRDLREHARDDGTEVGSDVLLFCVVAGGWVYLLLSGISGGGPIHEVLTIAIGGLAVLIFAIWAVLATWWPTATHVVLLGASSLLSLAAISVAYGERATPLPRIGPIAQLLMPLALAGFTAALALEPTLVPEASRRAAEGRFPGSRLRQLLLGVCLATACVFLGTALNTRSDLRPNLGSALVVATVAGLVGLRAMRTQRSMAVTNRRLEAALREREDAVDSLRTAVDELAGSEQRLRGLLDAAVDGVVEIGPGDIVIRANNAFRAMVGLDAKDLTGWSWQQIAERCGAEAPLAELRESGQATISTGGRTVHLEARASEVPTEPAGTLLLIRDVTASKVAEQTIRTLFQFLQDRDEDRTRYLRRTSVAIEAERNKIARDLHDGPIQGVAAASLSLEAARLMIDAGQHDRASLMLGEIQAELREETENLRRLMSDMRPPLLDERGLIPAVRDLCVKFEESTGIRGEVRATSDALVPNDVETIAYRVVQEALSNVKKHAKARNVTVRIASGKGSLEVEVQDDGVGFEASATREFLRSGKVGLASMRERTELGSGTFTLRSRPGAGTVVTALLPFDVLAQPRP
jgi:PAS domain S-box-containing protein